MEPSRAIKRLVAAFALMSAASTAIAVSGHGIFLNENQVLYLFSTSAQVLAGIYGLTLTGFLFFRNELLREEQEDETLAEAIDDLKSRYYQILVSITSLVFVALLLANLAITYEASDSRNVTAAIICTAQSAFIVSLSAIVYFVFEVVSPERIEFASKRLQESIDPASGRERRGSLEEFLRHYNQIETLLYRYGQEYIERSVSPYPYKSNRRVSNTKLAEILYRGERIRHDLYQRIRELVTLRNSIIHGAEPVVSMTAVDMAQNVARQLAESLNQDLHGEP